MRRRELGIYAFRTPAGGQGKLTAWFRLMREQGNYENIHRSIHVEETMVGCPNYEWMYKDLTPRNTWIDGIQNVWHEDHWMTEEIEYFNYGMMRSARRVGERLGMKTITDDYCPVCWSTALVSEKELFEKVEHIVTQAGRKTIPLYFVVVTDESSRKYGMSMPVVWMRYSFLRTFKVGQDIINIYRMMGKNIERIYDIPACPYPESYPL